MDCDELLGKVENPEALEAAYRADARGFGQAFAACREALPDNLLVRAWDARLAPVARAVEQGGLAMLVMLSLLAGAAVKCFDHFDLHKVDYVGLLAAAAPFFAMLLLRLHGDGWPRRTSALTVAASVAGVVALDAIPKAWDDMTLLSALYLGPLLWGVYGIARLRGRMRDVEGRAAFLRFSGEILVLCLLVLIGGGVVVLLAHQVLELLGLPTKWAWDWLALFGAAALPPVCAWATDRFGALHRILDVIARLFLPLVLPLVVLYLAASLLHLRELFTDRDMLLEFNVLLLCAVGVAVFVTMDGRVLSRVVRIMLWLTCALSLVALCAVAWRTVEYGITANRLAVAGNNLLLAANALLLAWWTRADTRRDAILLAQARFLPSYLLWAGIVVWVFPLFFHY